MQWHTTHSRKTCMSLLKCLHVMDENMTHLFPHPDPSLTPSRIHMPSVRKQWHSTHSSKTCMSLLKCLHVMDENVTHPFPHPEPSLTPSRMHLPSVRKHCFQNKRSMFLKTHYSIFDKILLDNPLNKYVGQSSKVNCWTTLRNSPLDIL